MSDTGSDIGIVESFPAMLRRVLGGRLKPAGETFLDMFAADGVVEMPFAPPGIAAFLEGRDAIAAHFQAVTKLIRLDNVVHAATHETSDPEVIIVEFAGFGQGLLTGEPYDQRYVSVVRVRDGRIVHCKDYWNPLAVLRTVKGREIMKSFAVESTT